MAHIRRHWLLTITTSMILMASGALWLRSITMGAVAAQEPLGYTPLTGLEYDKVRTLLRDVSLDRDVLIALNPSESLAESILDTLRTWRENNEQTLVSHKETIDRRVCGLRNLETAIRMGPYDEQHASQLSTARQDLAIAKADYRTTLASLETSIQNLLSNSQRTTWNAIKTGHGKHMPIRMLDLSDSQRLAVSGAQTVYQRQRGSADTEEARDAALSTFNGSLDQTLTIDQKTAKENFDENFETASANVKQAWDTVLAVQEG